MTVTAPNTIKCGASDTDDSAGSLLLAAIGNGISWL
jgi:hypothetical protein